MALTAGTRLGPYEVIARLGAGGMGVVYRARDTKLDRDVAIKVLPEGFAGDRDRFVRFQREARVLASLNHPQIAQIHGFEDADGTPALVMELVDGPTLADRLDGARLPREEALTIARQIAEALEAAHAQGIVHRDLKPANVKVRDDGMVKVLDFGLAKAIDPPSATPGTSLSPTLSLHATQAGIILGTAAYMAPEQARGKATDTRADVWAFGVVLFEMLAGARPFPGDEISDTLAGILKSEPPWDALPRDTPAAIRRLLRRCLQKDRQQRLQHIGDARLEIDEARGATAAEPVAVPAGTVRRPFLWIAAAAAMALTVGIIAGRQFSNVPEAPEMRLEISMPDGTLTHFAISPDGRSLVYARIGRQGRLQLRAFHESAPRALTGTEGAEYPFWSPDGRSLGFFANNRLQRLDSDGGTPQALATVITPAGGAWNRDGVILYVPNDSGGIFQVSAGGGESRMVTPQRTPPLATRLPQFLPDGRRFLFHVARGGEPAGVYVGALGSDAIQRILSTNTPAVYGSGHLWFIRDGAMVAQAFDPASLALSGPILPVADGVLAGLLGNSISTSAAGPIAYRASLDAGTRLTRQLVWFDRSGKQMGTAGEPGAAASNPSLSPDGRSLLLQRTVQENIDLWLIDLQRNVSSRLTDAPGVDSMPVWSPDGNRVIFNTTSTAEGGLAIATLDKTRPQERVPLPFDDGAKITSDWSTDGRFILYTHFNQSPATTDVWALPMDGDRKPLPVATTTYSEREAQFSPDGKWVAYESDEAGSPEIYLQPFPGPGAKQRVSVAGGSQARWRRDGRELYYIAADETLTAVAINPAAPSSVGTAARLFKTNISPIRFISRQQYVVSRDGQRFLILTDEEGSLPPVTLLFNWKPPATPTR